MIIEIIYTVEVRDSNELISISAPMYRDFPSGNFWRLIGKNVAREKGKNMENVEENGKRKEENEEKWDKNEKGKGRRKIRN